MGKVTAEIEGFVEDLARVPGNRRVGKNCVELREPPPMNGDMAAEAQKRRAAKRGHGLPITSEQKRIAAKRIERERAKCSGTAAPR